MTKEAVDKRYQNAAMNAIKRFMLEPASRLAEAQEAVEEALNWEYQMIPPDDRIKLSLKPPVVKVTRHDSGWVCDIA